MVHYPGAAIIGAAGPRGHALPVGFAHRRYPPELTPLYLV
jgi:hypothetical protein